MTLRNLKSFFKNVWNYRQFLWHNREWDYAHLFYMMELKLRHMRTELVNDRYSGVKRKKINKKTLSRAINALHWVNEVQFINDEELMKMGSDPKHHSWDRTSHPGYSTMVNSEEYSKRLRQWSELSDHTYNECVERAFKTILGNYRRWWS